MPILQIAPVTRRGMKLMVSLYGLSETGKTMSALRLAAGIEPDPQKRMLLDTEGGQRGRAYTDHIDGGYLYAQLSRPFTPERYIQALDEIEQAGVNVLVIDSISHAWFGEGGILDMVDEIPGDNFAKWKKPKRRLAKMTQRLMGSDMHIILCARAKEPLIDGRDANGKPIKVRGPVVPIQERTLWYDLTIVAQMLGDGEFDITRPQGKCPGMLRPFFAEGKVMDEALGRKLAAWAMAEGGKSPEHRRLELDAMSAAEAGVEAFRRFWGEISIEQRGLINANRGNYQSIATAADREREEQQANGEAPDDEATVTAEALKIQAAGAKAGKPAAAAAAPEKTPPPTADTKATAADEPPAVDLAPYQIAMPRRQDGTPHYTAWRGQIADRLAEAQDIATVDRLREANADWIDAAAGSDVEAERQEAKAIEARFADARQRITATTA
ncbi:hypothetical protein STAQ_28150 [Allostella sp. ATCC 35155]|nr:hypothetical protein STAQ_28150 [Stella sp. ATCC 35155]